ncbi:Cupredoxin [Naviculisporaceae sp. PSN 640]
MKSTTLLSLISTASAATIRIDVGKEGLTFSPDTVTAQRGDVLEYHFYGPLPHSVVQSDFSGPCNPSETGGFYSGTVIPNGNGENENVFRVTVNSTSPIFYYCPVQSHCQAGMAGVVNPSSSGSETLDAYKSAAQNADTSAPAEVFGGVLGPAEDDASSSTTSGTTSTPTPTGGNNGGASGGGNGNAGSALTVSAVGVLCGIVGVVLFMI